ncbi:hypothetical protein COCC4DRAFT_166974 [Bipolaris maydis ATCC 48331]|uniref:AAA+ ATPase domain-containing protein n=2 Tax=Cochliobolus heterostrophus TaxID=5016 RepID=M2UF51_COCH5|nr:uncharacterized protein COCC4DRAFT_166974 [Bipolaris maydis ATCC 48331]EMD86517.1 hypothetical protein COCHEDRAFT_1228504 [Bipolaris maydis C5]KAJ5029835.1 hypothetical protein J3E73DRAFT_428952 [Bipolaris maydis]ENI06465.1 hypothetical protein COCC4DRAFT_166974 [Bipolaris maydis ATCC 48331]KAJ6214128.1 hypothetical protein PSV09DRAFT_1228504 [Bipolaris maydis]KAJ6275321.1 hypothetical protein PSV08DRAFT_407698 [Bipolaris maydis]
MADVINDTLSLDENTKPATEYVGKHHVAAVDGEGERPTPSVGIGLFDELNDLKKKIAELETRQAKPGLAGSETAGIDPEVMADVEKYKRMEACLYKHRKEWELNIGPGDWTGFYRYARAVQNGRQRWNVCFPDISADNSYERPDVFDPDHDCGFKGTAHPEEDGKGSKDEYDITIDWGYRRDRVRKNFEWKSAKKQEQRKRHIVVPDRNSKLGEDQKTDSTAQVLNSSATPRLNPLEWYQFKHLAKIREQDANVVDILIGEPVIDDDVGANQLWFGYSGRQSTRDVAKSTGQKSFNPKEPGKTPLPERIRIHSDALLRIFVQILGSEGGSLDDSEVEAAVFIRPYKALAYREHALRDWCTALEKKLKRTSTSQRDLTYTKASVIDAEQSDEIAPVKGQLTNDTVTEIQFGVSTDPSEQVMTATGQAQSTLRVAEPLADLSEESGGEGEREENESEGNDPTKSPTALEHLKCLLQFLDSNVVAKRDYLNGPLCRKVFFSDLWYLFRPGVEVISSDGKQAYKVIGVTSEKHRMAPAWQKWYNPRNSRENKDRKKAAFSVSCVYIDFDGKHIGPVEKLFDFKRFEGEREVTSLEVYPLRFHPFRRSEYSDTEWKELAHCPDQERYRQKLILRGNKFLEVAGVRHMYYAGPTLEVKDEVESPVVIDFETAFTMQDDQTALRNQEQSPWKPELITLIGNVVAEENDDIVLGPCMGDCCGDDYVYDDQYVDEKERSEYINSLLPASTGLDEQPPITIMPRLLKELQTGPKGNAPCSEDELVIMSYRVFGFVLRSRKWAKLDLSHLTEVHPQEAASMTSNIAGKDTSHQQREEDEPSSVFDRLVLEKGHHTMIVSLIAQHFRDKKSTTGQREEFDLVKGKGKGLILLLHGAPGVGKTSTAEGVAEMFKKPLFQITCGDLGTTATEVESALEMNFSLANKWDCILLLDEADVFLAERTKEDFKRNGLVAVFLRLMEYYSGILFLTTNRVGDFDEAFTSRIHVSLYYPELSIDKTVQVFKINMDMIQARFDAKSRVIKIDREDIAAFAAKYFDKYPHARWNGRQIRNACQTAVALAESEALSRVPQDTENQNTVVHLTVKHFEVVRKAYLDFTKYMHDLYGSTSARRAKEAKLRAIWIDENDRVVRTQNMGGTGLDKKNAFLLASQSQPSYPHGHPPQQSFERPFYGQQPGNYPQPGYQQPQQQPQYYQNPNQNQGFNPHQPQYNNVPQGQMQGQPSTFNENWNNQRAGNSGVFSPAPQNGGQFTDSVPPRQQVTPSPQPQQTQPNPQWLGENIKNMYAVSGQQSNAQAMAGAGGATAGQAWNCPCGNSNPVHSGFCSNCGGKAQRV